MKTIKRRRKESKTNYLKRLKLLKSNSPRISFRRTNRYLIAQYIVSKEAQDEVIIGMDSKKLIKYGWPEKAGGSLKSIPAAYLLGFLIGKRINDKKLKKPILDLGMIKTIHRSRVYAFIEGLIDAGLDIKCDKDFFPSKERIEGKHMKNKIPFEEIKSKIEKEHGKKE